MELTESKDRISLAKLNAMDRSEFTACLGEILERSPHLVARAWPARPFSSLADLHTAIMDVVGSATTGEKLALLQAHPELGDRLARLTMTSRMEQVKAGLDSITEDEVAQLKNLNAQYRERYGFPFIICARLNSKRTIQSALARRIRNPPEAEFEKALAEVAKIARLRLADLVGE